MVSFRVTFRDLLLKRKMARAARMFADFTPEMRAVGVWLIADARKRLEARGSKFPTGRLGKSLRAHPYAKAVTVSSVLPYARIQQEGGVVRSKRPNGYLAIPLQDREKRNKAWPRHWSSELICLRSEGKLYLYSVKFKELVYRLVRQVRIPGRAFLVKSPELIRYLREQIAAKVKRADRAA